MVFVSWCWLGIQVSCCAICLLSKSIQICLEKWPCRIVFKSKSSIWYLVSVLIFVRRSFSFEFNFICSSLWGNYFAKQQGYQTFRFHFTDNAGWKELALCFSLASVFYNHKYFLCHESFFYLSPHSSIVSKLIMCSTLLVSH